MQEEGVGGRGRKQKRREGLAFNGQSLGEKKTIKTQLTSRGTCSVKSASRGGQEQEEVQHAGFTPRGKPRTQK